MQICEGCSRVTPASENVSHNLWPTQHNVRSTRAAALICGSCERSLPFRPRAGPPWTRPGSRCTSARIKQPICGVVLSKARGGEKKRSPFCVGRSKRNIPRNRCHFKQPRKQGPLKHKFGPEQTSSLNVRQYTVVGDPIAGTPFLLAAKNTLHSDLQRKPNRRWFGGPAFSYRLHPLWAAPNGSGPDPLAAGGWVCCPFASWGFLHILRKIGVVDERRHTQYPRSLAKEEVFSMGLGLGHKWKVPEAALPGDSVSPCPEPPNTP